MNKNLILAKKMSGHYKPVVTQVQSRTGDCTVFTFSKGSFAVRFDGVIGSIDNSNNFWPDITKSRHVFDLNSHKGNLGKDVVRRKTTPKKVIKHYLRMLA